MTEQEIFEKLKEALDHQYLITEFGGKEVTNLEEYLQAIAYERSLEKTMKDDCQNELHTYKEFIRYLNERACGDTQSIIEAIDSNYYNNFKGYLKVNKVIKDNKILLEFEIDERKLTAEWQHLDNYGVWQKCGCYIGDEYYGYLLFPTYDENEYFCLEYRC
jgi:hypothetical protein